jgi:hypothetical protein
MYLTGTETAEEHVKAFEEFDLHVQTTNEGESFYTLRFPEATKTLALHWDDIRELLDFAAVHGLGMKDPWVVESTQVLESAR